MSQEQPTLQEIARRTLWIDGIGLGETAVTRSLIEAGLDPDDRNERERFARLVRANYHYQRGEIAAELGGYFEQACEQLGRDAQTDEILRHAVELAHREQSTHGDDQDKTDPDAASDFP